MNELPLNFFILFVVVQLITMFYSVFTASSDFPHIFAASVSAFVGYINSNMILNGNVVQTAATTTVTTYIPVQSLPVHYLLLGFAVCMAIMAGYFIIDYVRLQMVSGESTFSFEGFN